MKGRYSTSAGVFAKRGDPWVTHKEAVRDFGRDPENEDPDFDFDYRFHHSANALGRPKEAEPRPEHQDPKGQPAVADLARRVANIRMAYRTKERARVVNVREVKPKPVIERGPIERKRRFVELTNVIKVANENGVIELGIHRRIGHCAIVQDGEDVAAARNYRDATAVLVAIEKQLWGL